MKLNKEGKELIKRFEGLKLQSYQCSAKRWTIGYGNTFYEDGTAVKKGDIITKERAEKLFDIIVAEFCIKVDRNIKTILTENQYSAIVSFTYNVGIGNLNKSTLLRKVNFNPNDPTIRQEFIKWNKAGGKVLAGLTTRRSAEALLYFKA